MFIGHYGVGLGGKAVEPRVSLGTWFLSVQFLDLLWPIFLLLGWEHVRIDPGNTRFTPLDFYDYPISRSLIAVLGWSFAFGAVSFALRRPARAALLPGRPAWDTTSPPSVCPAPHRRASRSATTSFLSRVIRLYNHAGQSG